ncbi:hypothetical protein FRZ67_16460 [Panacibacter ginsenosidivorans]|uniref:Uncharacterized protein n=1 Tax=Panacibacter ginsenosidivorans TaxID=1813871 RepID=A0A5B8VBX4_9BACT|nr:hypothetical protein [Panacibacter ginsenosidivorans]QEC68822.1 hypothetical protein FRZ67_16460 [Panacibacter ginsenosidivorans]
MSILEEIHFALYHNGKLHAVTATPYLFPVENGMPACFNAKLDDKNIGDIKRSEHKWENENIADEELLSKIGSFLCSKYK